MAIFMAVMNTNMTITPTIWIAVCWPVMLAETSVLKVPAEKSVSRQRAYPALTLTSQGPVPVVIPVLGMIRM